MPSLREMQDEFAAALLDSDRAVPSAIAEGRGAPRDRRFAVYRNNVVASLIDALGAAYPAVRRIVGEEFFRTMAGVFVRAHPPSTPVMARFGEAFPRFVEQFPPAARLAYLPAVARVERAWREAHHAADTESLSLEAVSRVPEERVADARLVPHPSLRIVRSRWAAGSLWQANTGDADGTIDVPVTRAEDVLVVRPELDVEVRILPPGDGAFVAGLLEGDSLGAAAARAVEEVPGFDLAAAIGGVFSAGAVVEVVDAGDTGEEGSAA